MPHRKQSLATSLRHVRAVMRKAEREDFTTRSEDRALQALYTAVIVMNSFLQELSQEDSICDCADRSWRGQGHDTQCNVERIAYLLSQIEKVSPTGYYVLFVDGDVEPFLYGPYSTEEERDEAASKIRAEDRHELKSAIYRLDCRPAPRIDTYSAAFFEDEEDANETHAGTAGISSYKYAAPGAYRLAKSAPRKAESPLEPFKVDGDEAGK